MITPRQRLIAFGLWLEMVVLFAACLVGLSLMAMGNMNCAVVQQATICPMASAEWLNEWQYFLAPVLMTSILVALLGALFAWLMQAGWRLPYDVASPPASHLWRKLFGPWAALVDYLSQQFSHGILHPKIY